ncbi:hypothetical protein A3I40_03090 [Candidatus Uhrbacteria bacterium RIFCSPLOWO2_02_FULL_48_12]|uniref:Uncharacterized protein n=1 Tax=Candidatus Uhrbacteria bacterium RIFCSPLOWO2_02_FULL_48_12 TaxID=1802407 RepID=A0A1F7V6R0_9BACT|nr:MAG: hypothetical protein A3I40_03090 [Candidatus Uhrbacteria bacterium RIFCSPLOWO2_02_FULL_48_12]
MDHGVSKQKKGYGLIGLLIVAAIIAILAVGGLYIGSSGERQSAIEINRDALKRAEDLQKMVEERNRQTEEMLENVNRPPAPNLNNESLSTDKDSVPSQKQVCGGTLKIPCPAGYECKLIDLLPSASGTCVPVQN